MSETCEACGAKVVEYKHRLNRPLIEALATAFKVAGIGPFQVGKLELTHSQQANFQKLRYWGLVERCVTEKNKHRGGWWRVTMFGARFLLGHKQTRIMSITFRGQVRRMEGEVVAVGDIVEGFELRGDYAAAAIALLGKGSNQLELGDI